MRHVCWRVLGLGSILWVPFSLLAEEPRGGCAKLDQARAALDFEEVLRWTRACIQLEPEKSAKTVEYWAEAFLELRRFPQAAFILNKFRHHSRFVGQAADAWGPKVMLLEAMCLNGDISKTLLESEQLLKQELPQLVRGKVEWIRALASLKRSGALTRVKREERFWQLAVEQSKATGYEHPGMMLVRLLIQLEGCRRHLLEVRGTEEAVLEAFDASNQCMYSVLATALRYTDDARRKEPDMQVSIDEATLPYFEDEVLGLLYDRIKVYIEGSKAFESAVPVQAFKQSDGERVLYQIEMKKELGKRREKAFLSLPPSCNKLRQKGPMERLGLASRRALESVLSLVCPSPSKSSSSEGGISP
jgi:hypothetical protein